MGNLTAYLNCTRVKSLALASLAVLTMAAPSAQARTISPEEALQRATAQPQAKTLNFKAAPSLVYTLPMNGSQTPGLYVFGNADKRGFIVVSADDQARALLGYSDNGVFDPENIPAPLAYWLDCYAQEIESLQEGSESQDQNRVVTRVSDDYLAPLMTTRWTQTPPYNNRCPQLGDFNTVTGCTATAMAQVMKYFNYPERGTGSNSYVWNNQTISSDFAAHTYDWSNMLDSYAGQYDTAQEEAISQFMRDCAISINTIFGIDNSSATTIDALKALINNFGYDPQARYMERKYYSLAEWEEAIYNQLDNHGPLVYAGTTSSNEGHAFVCDGYSKDYFHINWGWAGMSDGYYTLSALDPSQQGVGGGTSGYNSGQNIITNIYPSMGGECWIELVSDFSFNIKETSADVGKIINFSIGVNNLSAVGIKPNLGLAFTNISDNQTTFTTGSELNQELPPSHYFTTSLNVSQNIPGTLAGGNYIVRPAYKDLSGEWHILHVAMSQTRSYNATVSGNKVTFTENTAPIPNVTASALLTPLYSNSAFKASMTLRNPSNTEFYGMIYPCFLQGNVIKTLATEFSVTLEPQQTKQIEYIGTCNVPSGEYQMCYCIISPDDPGSYRVISNKIDVTVEDVEVGVPVVSNFRFQDDNTQEVNASALTFIFDLEVVDGIYQNPLYVALFPETGGSSINIFTSEPMFFNPGMNPDITLTTDISAWVEIGNSYYVALYARVNDKLELLSDYYLITIGSLNGINAVVSDPEDIAFSSYYNLNGVQISGVPSQKGLYIKVDTLRSGTVRSSKVMVK